MILTVSTFTTKLYGYRFMSNLWEDVGWVFSRAKFSFLIYTHNIYLNCWVDTRGLNQTKFVAENVIFYFRKSSLNLIGSIFSLVSAVKFNPIKHNLQNVSSVQPEVAHSLLLVFFFFDKWLHHFFSKTGIKKKSNLWVKIRCFFLCRLKTLVCIKISPQRVAIRRFKCIQNKTIVEGKDSFSAPSWRFFFSLLSTVMLKL